jgi:hypothetical protein
MRISTEKLAHDLAIATTMQDGVGQRDRQDWIIGEATGLGKQREVLRFDVFPLLDRANDIACDSASIFSLHVYVDHGTPQTR